MEFKKPIGADIFSLVDTVDFVPADCGELALVVHVNQNCSLGNPLDKGIAEHCAIVRENDDVLSCRGKCIAGRMEERLQARQKAGLQQKNDRAFLHWAFNHSELYLKEQGQQTDIGRLNCRQGIDVVELPQCTWREGAAILSKGAGKMLLFAEWGLSG